MSLLTRLIGKPRDEFARVRPLWHRTVELARDPAWYRAGGIEDSVAGRFDAITLVLGAVLLRLEREPALVAAAVRITELFVTDMDGQLRQSGVGDLVVGKHMGRLMAVLGGRLGALREAGWDAPAVAAMIARNGTLREGHAPDAAAALLIGLIGVLDTTASDAVLGGQFALGSPTA